MAAEDPVPALLERIAAATGATDLRFEAGVHLESDRGAVPVRASDGLLLGHLRTEILGAPGLEAWAAWMGRWLELTRTVERLRSEALRDELTGAWNRRHFDRRVAAAIAAAEADGRPVTVMVFDLDNFKQYNDRHGHAAGDEMLKETVRFLRALVRRSDAIYRIGGDEFAVVFDDADGPRAPGSRHPETAGDIVRRFQEQVCRRKLDSMGGLAPSALTISAGLASHPRDGSDPATLLHVADRRSLEAKAEGKDRIVLGPDACPT